MTRSAQIVLLAAVAAARLAAQGSAPWAFSRVPSDLWLNEHEHKGFHWSIRVAEPELSNHQRLVSRLEITVDGAELAKRRGKGSFVLLMQVTDERNHNWRDYESVDLANFPAAVRNSDAAYYRNFFVLPGDYQIVVVAYDTATSEHFVARRRLHVSPLHNDPLPDAWSGLPAVEFVRLTGGPANWYLPFVRNRVKIAAGARRPTRIEVVLNLSPPDTQAGSARVRNRNLAALLPSFKVLTQMEHGNTTLNAAVLNLTRQQVVFEQDSVNRLDWRKLMAAIDDDKPGIIDVKSLENRHASPQFFAGEVLRRLNPVYPSGTGNGVGESGGESSVGAPESADEPRAVIVLTSPVVFEDGADLRPIEGVPPDARLFYLRYQPLPTIQLTSGRRSAPRRAPDGLLLPPRAGYGPAWDQLESVFKPAEPKLYDVSTPEQFRRALAAVLAEIAKM